MKGLDRAAFLTVALLFGLDGIAQTSTSRQTISTYVGASLPASGTPAVTQVFDSGSDPVPDGAGGFYFVSLAQNRVYRVRADGTLLVIAGTGANGFSGDGGPAIAAELSLPTGIALDAQGNLFVADLANDRVRKVTPAGIISTIAGTGVAGSDGDGGPATSARVNPFSLTVDSAGNLFISEIDENRVRKVNPAGVISTVAGSGTRGYGGDGGPAVPAQLFGPKGLSVDASSNLYITDTFNNRIRKVTPAGIISTVAGTGTKGSSGDAGPATSAELDWPSDTALTSSGNLLIADSGRVRSVNPSGVISTIAGGGSAAVQLGPLSGISVDSAGNIFIGEPDGGLIRKISPSGVITIVAGHGRSLGFGGDSAAASEARLSHPWGLGFDAVGNLFIADTENDRIRMVSPNGIITTVVGTGGAVAGNGIEGFGGDGEAAVSAQLAGPSGIAVDAAGNLFITDTGNHRIRKVNSAGIITTVAGLGTPGFGGDGGPAISAQLASPSAIALDMAGNLIVADSGNNRVRKVTPAGMISTIAGVGTAGFSGDGAIATAAQLSLVGSSETLSTGLVVDAAGNIYIADTGNHRIRRVSPGGVVTTIAGSGVRGFSGDGGQAALAQLFNPSGIAMDRAGQMFVSDTFNNRVRRVTFTSETTFTIPDRGGVLLQSSGTSTAPAAGYARIQPDNTSQTPAGLAILGLRQNKARSSFPTSPPAANGPPMWF